MDNCLVVERDWPVEFFEISSEITDSAREKRQDLSLFVTRKGLGVLVKFAGSSGWLMAEHSIECRDWSSLERRIISNASEPKRHLYSESDNSMHSICVDDRVVSPRGWWSCCETEGMKINHLPLVVHPSIRRCWFRRSFVSWYWSWRLSCMLFERCCKCW